MNQSSLSLIDEIQPLDRASAVVREIEALVTGLRKPYFPKPGRSAWLLLNQPLMLSGTHNSIEVKSLKIKGIGLGNPDGSFSAPSLTPYYRDNPHLGFKLDGTFTLVHSAPAPLGGITLRRARREFEIARRLVEGGCPSIAPVRLYQFDDPALGFKEDENDDATPLGVVVMGIPLNTPSRADSVLHYGALASGSVKTYVETVIDDLAPCDSVNAVLSAISALVHRFGRTLRKFHQLGYYRYSGTMDNYIYSTDSSEVMLVDLDSSRELSECSPLLKLLQIMRDVASGIFNLAAGLMTPALIENYPTDSLRLGRPVLAFMSGYYHDVEPILLDRLAAVFESYYLPVHERVFKHRFEIASGTTEAERLNIFRKYWMNRTLTYSLLMVLLWQAHQASDWRDDIPAPLSYEELCKRATEFSSVEICELVPEY
jgi:hypothetical protein